MMGVYEGRQPCQTQIMGIINATPDSFHADSRAGSIESAMEMIKAGADWIDIGGESTRPGATPVSIADELARTIPIVKAIAPHCQVSIDTRNVEVARAALEAGATMINDISGLRDPEMVDLVIDSASKVCIMHMLGEPQTMQSNPEYTDVVAQVNGYLLDKARELVDKGHSIDDIYLDPGIGFGKNLEHNIELLNSSDSLRPYSVLWGVSRKSMIGQLTGKTDSAERLAGSLAIGALAHSSKIDIIRVHDVDEHMDLFKVLDAMEA